MVMKIVNISGKWCLIEDRSDEIVITELEADKTYEVSKAVRNARTVKQNASIHLYLTKVSKSLNDGGFTVQKVVALFKKAGIQWTMLSVKDVIWRNIQVAITGKESTTQINTDEVTKVYRTVDHYLSTVVGIESIDFPSEESMIFEKNYKSI